MQQRTLLQYFIISLKGMAMGVADAVPGVSGGTIAFISGIYEELLTSISSVNFNTLKLLKTNGIKAVWKAINGNFLLALLLGIVISFVSFMKLAKFLIENHPILIWSFFFGLVLASILFIGKQVQQWGYKTIFCLLIAAFLAFYITTLPSLASNNNPMFLFIAGAIAICAMILPGISGSFILVILGAYKALSDAVDEVDIKRLMLFVFGAIVGLLSFSRILKWLFSHFKNLTLAVLTGFILGSLNKIWPWKKTITVWDIEAEQIIPFSKISNLGTLSVFQQQVNNFESYKAIKEISILPIQYSSINHYINSQLTIAILFMLIGFAVILLLEKIANTSEVV